MVALRPARVGRRFKRGTVGYPLFLFRRDLSQPGTPQFLGRKTLVKRTVSQMDTTCVRGDERVTDKGTIRDHP